MISKLRLCFSTQRTQFVKFVFKIKISSFYKIFTCYSLCDEILVLWHMQIAKHDFFRI